MSDGDSGEVERLKTQLQDLQRAFAGQYRQLAAYRRRIEKLHRERTMLTNRLARANWKLRATKQRRWWRLGAALRWSLRDPRRLLLLPAELIGVLFGSARKEEPPEPVPFSPAFGGQEPVYRRPESEPPAAPPPPRPQPRKRGERASVRLGDLRVAAIVQPSTALGLGPECQLVTFRPDNWREVLSDQRPHLLLVESAWDGNDGSWRYRVAGYPHPDSVGLPDLRRLVDWCRSEDIPTVFWADRDPLYFDSFREAARLFDLVFTSDPGSVDRHRAAVVKPLLPAAQPGLHNPIGAPVPRRPEPGFIADRPRHLPYMARRQIDQLLEAARAFGLELYDPAAPDLVAAYKRHRVFLHGGAEPRRVFELLACGTPVVAAHGIGLEQELGDLMAVAGSPEELAGFLDGLQDEERWRRLSWEGVRRVMAGHTYAHRLRTVAEATGYHLASDDETSISLIALSEDGPIDESVEVAEVLVGGTGGSTLPPGARSIRQPPDVPRSDRYRQLAALAVSPWVAVWGGGAEDPRELLEGLAICRSFVEAEVIGFSPDDVEQRFVNLVDPRIALVRRELVASRGWPEDGDALRGWWGEGVRIYAAGKPLAALQAEH